MTDGFGIFYRRWRPVGEAERALVCIHGLPGQSAQFDLIGQGLAARGTEVYAIDLRGFGNSVEDGLERGDTKDFDRHLQDIDEVVGQVRKNHPGKRLFVLGYSVGGNYALWYAAGHPDSVDGLILVAPAIRRNSNIAAKDLLPFLFAVAFTPAKQFEMRALLTEEIKKSDETELLFGDPLIPKRLSARYLSGTRPLFTKALGNASRVGEPTLILQGDRDIWVQPIGAKELFEALTVKDKSLRTLQGADHDFFKMFLPELASGNNQANREEVMSIVNDWLKARR